MDTDGLRKVNKMKWLNIGLGIIVTFMGALPFLGSVLPDELNIIPSSGNGYAVIILILGVLIIVNTVKERRTRLRLR